jgi:hypothetical protein
LKNSELLGVEDARVHSVDCEADISQVVVAVITNIHTVWTGAVMTISANNWLNPYPYVSFQAQSRIQPLDDNESSHIRLRTIHRSPCQQRIFVLDI